MTRFSPMLVQHAQRSSPVSARIVTATDAREPQMRAQWEHLLDQHRGTTLFYQSPDYFNHLTKLRDDCAFLGLIEDEDGMAQGIVPMRKTQVVLKFEAGSRRLAQLSYAGLRILGSTLLMPQTGHAFELLFREIATAFPHCEAMDMSGVPTNSPLWEFLRHSPSLRRDFAIYTPHGSRNCHTVQVPASFEEYLAQFGRKKQYNLKRQIRRLDEFGQGSLELQRIDRASAVDSFHDARAALGAAWDRDSEVPEREVLDLAERGLLLSYVLKLNGRPCAVAFGTRFRDTLLMHSFRHDTKLAHLSPGTVLQTLMMRDLAGRKLAARIDFGFGEPRYRSANEVDERIAVVLLRKTMLNRSLITAHRAYGRLVQSVKRAVRT